jgi:hypothetical protein
MIEVIVRVIRSAVVADPAISGIHVWCIWVSRLITEIAIRHGRSLLRPVLRLPIIGSVIIRGSILRSGVLLISSSRGATGRGSWSARRDMAAVKTWTWASASFASALLSTLLLSQSRPTEQQCDC